MQTERERTIGAVGARVRALRTNLVMTQIELANRAEVSRDVVARLETGKGLPYPENLRKIAAVLGVEPSALMEGVSASETTVERIGGAGTVSAMSRPRRDSTVEDTERLGRAYGIVENLTLGEILAGVENLSDERREALDVVRSHMLPDDSYLDSEEKLPEEVSASAYVVENRR